MSSKPTKNSFLLRLDPIIHQKLTLLSKQQKQSINTICTQFIKSGIQEKIQDQNWINEIAKKYLNEKLLAIILFGSQARNEASESSDIDILLVFEQSTKITRSLYRKFETIMETAQNGERHSAHCVSLPTLDSSVSSFWFEIALDGKILWKKNEAIIQWLSKVKNVICSGKYSRKSISGQPYWIQNEK